MIRVIRLREYEYTICYECQKKLIERKKPTIFLETSQEHTDLSLSSLLLELKSIDLKPSVFRVSRISEGFDRWNLLKSHPVVLKVSAQQCTQS
jgi:hypothetical protein